MNNFLIVLQIVIAKKFESLEGIKHYTIDIQVYGTLKSILLFVYNDASLIEIKLNTSHGRISSLDM